MEITTRFAMILYMGKVTKWISFFYLVADFEDQAMDVFREYLEDKKYRDTERFFSEWKMTFQSDGPFKTEQDLQLLSEKMTKPDDFMVRIIIPLMSCKAYTGTLSRVTFGDFVRFKATLGDFSKIGRSCAVGASGATLNKWLCGKKK